VGLLVPASAADLTALGGVVASYDVTLRPEHTVQVIQYLQDHGVTPALWEVEGLVRTDRDTSPAEQAAAAIGGPAADDHGGEAGGGPEGERVPRQWPPAVKTEPRRCAIVNGRQRGVSSAGPGRGFGLRPGLAVHRARWSATWACAKSSVAA
jgi:hypothetical protein